MCVNLEAVLVEPINVRRKELPDTSCDTSWQSQSSAPLFEGFQQAHDVLTA